jgi:predicted subunit of tRNA(5-methylaminomethyl-2-thiouridylate) methyltransferase
VALARRETTRTLCSLPCRLAQAVEDRVTVQYCNGVDGIAKNLILVEGYASQVTG